MVYSHVMILHVEMKGLVEQRKLDITVQYDHFSRLVGFKGVGVWY